MNERNDATAARPSRWRKFLGAISAFERAMDDDPHEGLHATLWHLAQRVQQLEARVNTLEGRRQPAVSRNAA